MEWNKKMNEGESKREREEREPKSLQTRINLKILSLGASAREDSRFQAGVTGTYLLDMLLG